MSSGRIYDRGYKRYEGIRQGPNASTLAVYRHAVRRAVGLRRSWKQKLIPWTLLGIVTIPAFVEVGIVYMTKNRVDIHVVNYREYIGVSNALLLFVAVTAPDLLCPDRRQRVLPLYFSRPMTGARYVIAKVGALVSVLFAFVVIPELVLFVGLSFLAENSAGYVRDNAQVLVQIPAAALCLAVFYGLLGSAVASITTRRIVGASLFLGAMLGSLTVANILTGAGGFDLWGVANIGSLPLLMRDLIFLGEPASDSVLSRTAAGGALGLVVFVALSVGSASVLAWRYRWNER